MAEFVETARKLGCNESGEAFHEKLKAIARLKAEGKPVAPEATEAV